MQDTVLFHAFIYLAAAVIAVPLASRLGLGSVLGYLAAGAIIGPHMLGLVGSEGQDVQRFAEYGVVMMLFLIGLELEPARLWKLRKPILGMGGFQFAGTALLVALLAPFFGGSLRSGLALGLALAMSSTAIALQSLQEKGLDRTEGGQSSFSVLLFQDLAVIPSLALLPLLATVPHAAEESRGIATLPGWLQAISMLGAVVVVVIAGRYLSRPIFRAIAAARLHEVFSALALLMVVGISLLMHAVGLSPALGAFVAGVVLANSEYRHELVSNIEPFKGLLLGLFFLTVGAGVDFAVIGSQPGLVCLLVLSVVVAKFGILVGLGRLFRIPLPDSFIFAAALSQVGEFAFVLLGLTATQGVLSQESASLWTGVVALSMAMSPLVLVATERLVLPRFNGVPTSGRSMDDLGDAHAGVIIAGFGRVGNMVGRLLRGNGIATTVLDLDPNVVDVVRLVGLHAFYGDASRPDLLHAAGAEKARLLILAIDNPEKALEIATEARRRYPDLRIMARVSGHPDAYRFIREGFDHVYRETYGTAMEMGYDALCIMGLRAHQAHRAVQIFRRHNHEAVRDLAAHWGGDKKTYLSRLREKIHEIEEMMKRAGLLLYEVDHAWDNTSLRDDNAEWIQEEVENPGLTDRDHPLDGP